METEIVCAGCDCDLCDMEPEEATQQDGAIFYTDSPMGPLREPVRKGSFLCDYCRERYRPTGGA